MLVSVCRNSWCILWWKVRSKMSDVFCRRVISVCGCFLYFQSIVYFLEWEDWWSKFLGWQMCRFESFHRPIKQSWNRWTTYFVSQLSSSWLFDTRQLQTFSGNLPLIEVLWFWPHLFNIYTWLEIKHSCLRHLIGLPCLSCLCIERWGCAWW